MQLFLRNYSPNAFARPIVLLTAGTLLRHMWELDLDTTIQDGLDHVIYVDIVRMESVGMGAPLESPTEPGRIGHRKKARILTIDVHYNEISMVLDRVTAEKPEQIVPYCRDFAEVFVERIEAATEKIVAWFDRKKLWLDREAFLRQWAIATDAAKSGNFVRPYEFTTNPKMRDAMDAAWTVLEEQPWTTASHESLADAYMRLREVGWNDAEYEADPDQAPTLRGQPCKVANYDVNLATSQAPDPTFTFSLA